MTLHLQVARDDQRVNCSEMSSDKKNNENPTEDKQSHTLLCSLKAY